MIRKIIFITACLYAITIQAQDDLSGEFYRCFLQPFYDTPGNRINVMLAQDFSVIVRMHVTEDLKTFISSPFQDEIKEVRRSLEWADNGLFDIFSTSHGAMSISKKKVDGGLLGFYYTHREEGFTIYRCQKVFLDK